MLEKILDNEIKDIENKNPGLVRRAINFLKRKSLYYVLSSSIFITSTLGLNGCTDDTTPINTIPTKSKTSTQLVQRERIKKGEIDLKDTRGNEFSLDVYDEKTDELISGLEVYVINHSTEVLIEDPLKRYLSYFFAFDKFEKEHFMATKGGPWFRIRLPKIDDLIKENKQLYKYWVCATKIGWNKDTEKINKEPIPLSKLYEFYEENKSDNTTTLLELVSDYWIAGVFAKELLGIRDSVLKYGDEISKMLGINPDEILFDIYREPLTGILYHKRVDNSKVGNLAPIIGNLYIQPDKNKLLIEFELSDANADICSIEVFYNINKFDASRFDGKSTIDPEKCRGLEASLIGKRYWVRWTPTIDLKSDVERIWISLRATDSKGKIGPYITSKCIDVTDTKLKEIFPVLGLNLSTPEAGLENYFQSIKKEKLEDWIYIAGFGEEYTDDYINLLKHEQYKTKLKNLAKDTKKSIENLTFEIIDKMYGLFLNEEVTILHIIATNKKTGKKAPIYFALIKDNNKWLLIEDLSIHNKKFTRGNSSYLRVDGACYQGLDGNILDWIELYDHPTTEINSKNRSMIIKKYATYQIKGIERAISNNKVESGWGLPDLPWVKDILEIKDMENQK